MGGQINREEYVEKHHATCQCGALTIDATAGPDFVVLCNCKACQRRTGAPFGVGAYFRKTDAVASGTPKVWNRIADSGRELRNHFCEHCGTTVYWTFDMRPDHIGVALGTIEGPMPEPVRAVWTENKHPWVTFPAHWKVYDKATP